MNHQESEPNYFIDKWLAKRYAREFATLFDVLLEQAFETVVVGAKWKDRDEYMAALEAETSGTVVPPEDLPIDLADVSGVVFAYTDATYQYGMESVLLNVVADTVIGNDLPMDHGWIVQNTETLYNIYRALTESASVTRKYVHVGGDVPRHRFLSVPLGTPVRTLLEAAGHSVDELGSNNVLLDGGPGWCFRIDDPIDSVCVRKHTNCLMVVDSETVEANTLGNGRINLLDARNWKHRAFETTPSSEISPSYVCLPLITNSDLEGAVQPAEVTVAAGDDVESGERIATATDFGTSIPCHSPVDGTVIAVTDRVVKIEVTDVP
jgi:Na+-translocating ferredoxin:NAD+ oxidoreductase RnfC subunit